MTPTRAEVLATVPVGELAHPPGGRGQSEPGRAARAMIGAVLVTGIPGSGKTTVARLLASRFPRAAHIEGDAGKTVFHLWRHLDEELRDVLGGRGVWLDTSALTPEETVDQALAGLEDAAVA